MSDELKQEPTKVNKETEARRKLYENLKKEFGDNEK